MSICSRCGDSFEISDKEKAFLTQISPIFDGKRFELPASTECQGCRIRVLLSFRNERFLYETTCALSHVKMLTMYPKKSNFIVYDAKYWWSDRWDPLSFGRDFDPNRSFFEQFKELFHAVPKYNLYNFAQENSEYTNFATHNKDSYLVFGSWFNENCLYGNTMLYSSNCLDGLFLEHCSYCYEIIDCISCYQLFFSQLCSNCSDSWFLFDCKNCKNCIGCTNLSNKENYLFNKPSTKAEIAQIKEAMDRNLIFSLAKKLEELKKNAIFKAITGFNNEAVSGNFIYNSKNIENSFAIYDCEDLANAVRSMNQKSSRDITGCGKGELLYQSFSTDFSYTGAFLMWGEGNSNLYYCSNCYHCKNCFGCDGLNHKEFCILNKQYSKEEYEKIAVQIILTMQKTGEWGKFFSPDLSPFGYNKTMAHEFFPLSKKEAAQKGFLWDEDEQTTVSSKHIVPVPDSILTTPESIIQTPLFCPAQKKFFKITPQEFAFYKKFLLPIPTFCFEERHFQRMKKRNPLKLFSRTCERCHQGILTSYDPLKNKNVYCDSCYTSAIF